MFHPQPGNEGNKIYQRLAQTTRLYGGRTKREDEAVFRSQVQHGLYSL